MKYILLLICAGLSLQMQAQIGKKNSLNISLGGDAMLPSRSFGEFYNLGYGATLKGEYVFAKHLSATAATSYYIFNSNSDRKDFQGLALMGGLRYYVSHFYMGAEAGSFFNNSLYDKASFIYAISFGDEIVTGKHGNSLDVSIRFNSWRTTRTYHFYGLRVAYEFRLR